MGMGGTVLDHVVVGEGAIVAAGALGVGVLLLSHIIWAGVTCKICIENC